MTFNIRLGRQMGIGPIARLLRRTRPDLVALQEVGSNWREGPGGDTARRLAYHSSLEHVHFTTTIGRRSSARYGHALLSKWPLRGLYERHLPMRNDEPRIATCADVVTPEGTRRVVSTHISHLDSDRHIQGPEFAALLDDERAELGPETPFVILGDLNEPRSHPDAWLEDILGQFDEACRIDPAPTFENPVPEERIDYLLVAGARWQDASVLDRPDLSDHRPVVADL